MRKYLESYIKELENKPSKKVIDNMYNKYIIDLSRLQ